MAGRSSGRSSQPKKRQPRGPEPTQPTKRKAPSPEAMARAKAKLSPPPAPWHPLPLAELAIVFGLLAILIAAFLADRDGIMAGFFLIVLGTAEFSWREHHHGFRSHATVLAMIIGVIVGAICWRTTGLGRNPCIAIGGVVFLIAWGLFDRAYVPQSRREADGSKPPAASK